MDVHTLKQRVLEGMCTIAEEIDLVYYGAYTTNFCFLNSEAPKAFKPNMADRLIFSRIFDDLKDVLLEEIQGRNLDSFEEKDREHQLAFFQALGTNILARYYYPQYGTFKTMPVINDSLIRSILE